MQHFCKIIMVRYQFGEIHVRKPLVLVLLIAALTGCATYTTPGAGVNVGDLSAADEDIAEIMRREPAAPFPARLSVARAQAPGYSSDTNSCYGTGRYCIVTSRDVETEDDFARIGNLPMVADIAPLNRILLPEQLNSVRELRIAAAKLKTDILLIYSFDTRFNVESADVGPFQLISLGFLPNKKAHVTTTASAALFDVRTGFVYGVAEHTATEQQRATFWSSYDAIEKARLKTESASFEGLLDQLEALWKQVVEAHAAPARS